MAAAMLKKAMKSCPVYCRRIKINRHCPFGRKYRQRFSFPMIVMDGKMQLSLDNKQLLPVRQFVVAPDCPPVNGKFPLVYLPAAADTVDALFDSLLKVVFR
jgi:hypothetical protein